MSSERPKKKAKTRKDAAVVSAGSGSSGGRPITAPITPELIAHVATFADAVNSYDVMNTCLAVGPNASRTVRYYYLYRNYHFLSQSLLHFGRKVISRDKARDDHLAWMKVNTDWKTMAVRDDLMEKLKVACKKGEAGQSSINIFHPLTAFNNPVVVTSLKCSESSRWNDKSEVCPPYLTCSVHFRPCFYTFWG